MSIEQSDAYSMIDRYLRNNLGDDDYAEFSAALDAVAAPIPQQPAPSVPEGFTEAFVDDFLLTYEQEGEDDQGRDCSYSPNERERFLIKDAALGMLSELEGGV